MHEQFLARQKQGKSLEKQALAEQKPDPASEFIYAAVDPAVTMALLPWAEGLKAVFTDLAADAVVSGGQSRRTPPPRISWLLFKHPQPRPSSFCPTTKRRRRPQSSF